VRHHHVLSAAATLLMPPWLSMNRLSYPENRLAIVAGFSPFSTTLKEFDDAIRLPFSQASCILGKPSNRHHLPTWLCKCCGGTCPTSSSAAALHWQDKIGFREFQIHNMLSQSRTQHPANPLDPPQSTLQSLQSLPLLSVPLLQYLYPFLELRTRPALLCNHIVGLLK